MPNDNHRPSAIIKFPQLRLARRRAPSFDAETAIDALHLAAGQLVAHLATLHREIERQPMPDADPDRDVGALSRVSVVRHLLDAAEIGATSVRVALSTLAPRQDAVERVQVEAGVPEAMLTVLGRELDRAPWNVSDGRIGLLVELVAAGQDAARLVRAGLGAVAERLARER